MRLHTAPILYHLVDYQDYVYTVKVPAVVAFYFKKLIFHVV